LAAPHTEAPPGGSRIPGREVEAPAYMPVAGREGYDKEARDSPAAAGMAVGLAGVAVAGHTAVGEPVEARAGGFAAGVLPREAAGRSRRRNGRPGSRAYRKKCKSGWLET